MIKKVWIKNVRNVSELLLDFESYEHGYIYGGNNQGKTTVLEAIYLAAKQNSPIQNDIKKIITEHQQECVVGLDLVHDTRKRLYARFFYDGKKDIRLNEKKKSEKNAVNEELIIYQQMLYIYFRKIQSTGESI